MRLQLDILSYRLAETIIPISRFELARSVYRRYAKAIEGIGEVAASYRQERNPDSANADYNQLLARDSENAIRWKGEIKKYSEAIGIYTALLGEIPTTQNNGVGNLPPRTGTLAN